jgi:hypothetical protein
MVVQLVVGPPSLSPHAQSYHLPPPNKTTHQTKQKNPQDYYAEQSCTAGRATFITGQNPYRTGLTKVGMPGAKVGLQPEDPTIARALKNLGYATGQFGKNHLGDRDEHLPTNHGFDEFFGNVRAGGRLFG